MNKHFLEVKNLLVEYTSGGIVVEAVNGVNFTLDRGKTLGLVGETGAGKTTIAKAIMRILPDPPAKILNGTIYLDDEDFLAKSEKEMLKIRGSKVAMIFQDPMTALNPVMSVGKQIAEVILAHDSISAEKARSRACEMLEIVGIPAERYVEYPHQFSGGMKQRVVIAMALACSPQLLLADEPTTALDVTIQAQVLEMIQELRDKFNMSMVLITHDLGVVAETCDDVAIVYAGRIVEIGSKEDIFWRTSHPYTEGLFGAIPKMDDDSKRLNPVPGTAPDPTCLPQGCAFHPRCRYATNECKFGEVPRASIGPGHFCLCHHPLKVQVEGGNE